MLDKEYLIGQRGCGQADSARTVRGRGERVALRRAKSALGSVARGCVKNVFVLAEVEIEAGSVRSERVAPFNVNNSVNCRSSGA